MVKIGTLLFVGFIGLVGIGQLAGAKSGAVAPDSWRHTSSGKWSFDASVAAIAQNSTFGLLRNQGNDADGEGGGRIYNLAAAYRLKEFNFTVGDSRYHPLMELRGGLGLVDENANDPFMNYSAEVIFRWRDFPWNRWVSTSIGLGGGLLYSEEVLAVDRLRHQGRKRAHIKFSMPIELTLALPQYPQVQLLLFNHHFSGAHIFDEGGFDTFGAGLRYQWPW